MPNGEDRNLIRMLSTIRGFRILYGRWPKRIRIETYIIRWLYDFLSHAELSSLNKKIQLVPLDDEDFIADDDEGCSYSLMEHGHPSRNSDIDPAKWLGLEGYIRHRSTFQMNNSENSFGQVINNREILENLFSSQGINLKRSSIFTVTPAPLGPNFDFARIEGMMLGLAIGDALGNTTESWFPRERRARFGDIRDYLPNREKGEKKGLPSDDTQLAFWTLEQMLEDSGFVPDRLASRFCRGRIFGIGGTVREFIRNYKNGLPWYQCGPHSAGNGALMRIAPMLIPHLLSATPDLWIDTALSAMITHNDSGSIAACLAFINILWELLHMEKVPDPGWWPATYVAVAKELECSDYRPRGGEHLNFYGPIWKFVTETVEDAFARNLSVLAAGNIWYSGAFLLETVPTVLYILMRYAHAPEEAIIRAVNDTKDNDTIAAIVGAAIGALHGREKIPERWLTNLTGRTAEDDDGKVYELLSAAQRLWGPKQ